MTVEQVDAPAPERVPAGPPVRRRVRGNVAMAVEELAGQPVVVARSTSIERRGALSIDDGATLATAAELAMELRIPLVLVLASSGADVSGGIESLHGWGRAARAFAAASGSVPILAAVTGPAISGPALMLGIADVVLMTPDAFAFVSGPRMVEDFTGITLGIHQLGGTAVHARSSGLCALEVADEADALAHIAYLLSFLPANSDEEPPLVACDEPLDEPVPSLRTAIPDRATSSYDVRTVAAAVCDDRELLELAPRWSSQLVTALGRVGGRPVGFLANQPQTLAGTLDIAASQKGARFVRFCDAFNLPLVTLVDTPGFLPGKDLEWRGMIRHGAELAFAYAEATVPRVCVILRKAFGGAYIVMDSKGLGNDLCYAWPSAEIAVMGAQGAVQILYRKASPGERQGLQDDFTNRFLTPWQAAERGFVDAVIDPADTRSVLAAALGALCTEREHLPGRKHALGPL